MSCPTAISNSVGTRVSSQTGRAFAIASRLRWTVGSLRAGLIALEVLEMLANCCNVSWMVPRRWGIPAASSSRKIEVTFVDPSMDDTTC